MSNPSRLSLLASTVGLALAGCTDIPDVSVGDTELAATRAACTTGVALADRTLAFRDGDHLVATYGCLARAGDGALDAFEAAFPGFRSRRRTVGGGDPVLQTLLDRDARVNLGGAPWTFEIETRRDHERETRDVGDLGDDYYPAVSLIQSNYGTPGNFEVVAARGGAGIRHLFRDNDDPTHPWHVGPVFGLPYGYNAVSMLQGSYGGQGNFELVAAVEGGGLEHFARDNDDPTQPWSATAWFGGADELSGASLIMSSNGDFDVISSLATGGLQVFHRWNGIPGTPWASGVPFSVATTYNAVAMIESNDGDLEAVAARNGGGLEHFTHAGIGTGAPFVHTATFGSDWYADVALIQSNIGVEGNFEVIGSRPDGYLWPWYRDNDAPGTPWHAAGMFGSGSPDGVALIQSNFGLQGNFEVVATRYPGGLRHYFRDNDVAGLPWTPTTY